MNIFRSGLILLTCYFFLPSVFAQEIVNIVLVGENGVTDNIKKAKSFILVKKYPGNIFERLDYHRNKPLTRVRTFSDSLLTIQEGPQLEYFPSGQLKVRGFFQQNKKHDDWWYYNDTGKHVLTETYKEGLMISSKVPDTTKKKDSTTYGDEREADMKGGPRAWKSYLMKALDANIALSSAKGGQVRVLFTVGTDGKTRDIYLKESVEFVLDEEAIRVIRASPLWIPAFQNGRAVNAYRIQPLTFVKQ